MRADESRRNNQLIKNAILNDLIRLADNIGKIEEHVSAIEEIIKGKEEFYNTDISRLLFDMKQFLSYNSKEEILKRAENDTYLGNAAAFLRDANKDYLPKRW